MRANNFATINFRWLAAVAILTTGCANKVVAPVVQPPPPATLSTMAAAKTAFVLNTGQDLYYTSDIPGSVSVTYNEFYTSLKQTGRFQLVGDPRKAALVFSIYGTETDPDISPVHLPHSQDSQITQASFYPPMMHLDISEPGAKQNLYTFTWAAGRGSNIPKGTIAFANSIDALTAKMMSLLVGQTVSLPDATTLVQAVAPVPTPITEGKTLYLRSGSNVSRDYIAALTDAVKAWGRFQIVDTPDNADLIFDETETTIFTGGSAPLKLWTLSRPKGEVYPGYGAKQEREVAAAVVKRFQALVAASPAASIQ